MALLAESVVEEWLNREGFFTIRGVKHGVGEMDILAVRREPNGRVTGWHVEVQASFRPIGYMTPPSNARKRSLSEMDASVTEWVRKKFRAEDKNILRLHLWTDAQWSFHLVHAVVRDKGELELIRGQGITLHRFCDVLESLCREKKKRFSGSAGGDLAEIVQYYKNYEVSTLPNIP